MTVHFPETSAIQNPITLQAPARIEFGDGSVGRIAPYLEARNFRKPLVVTSAFNARRLDAFGLPKGTRVFAKIPAEPTVSDFMALLAAMDDAGPDVVIGIGGGSVMDCAKLAACLFDSGQALEDAVGVGKIRQRHCAIVQVPTTAGTGSEVGTRSLLLDPATQTKLAFDSPLMIADLAVVDPSLAVTVPAHLTAETGIDALAHCTEAYTSRRAHPIIDTYAIAGIELVGRYLPLAVQDGANTEARAGLALAAMYGGFCLGPVNTTAGHAIAYPLGTRHRMGHGLANAIIFPHVLAYNAPAAPAKTRLIADALKLETADLRESAVDFCRGLGIKMRLGDHGIPPDSLPRMAADAHAIRRLLDNNPRDISVAEIEGLYRAAY